MKQEIVPVRLEFKNVAANANISVLILSNHIGWSLGKNIFESSGLTLEYKSNEQNRFLSKIDVSHSLLSLATNSEMNSNQNTSFIISLFLRFAGERFISVMATLNDECEIMHTIGMEKTGTWSGGLCSANW